MKNIKILILATLLAVGSFASAATQTDKHNWQTAKELVLEAAKYARQNGHNALLEHINRGGFEIENSYVFMINSRGFILAHPNRKDLVGTNRALERHYMDRMIDIIGEYNEGWIEYHFTDPKTGKNTPKLSYVKQISANAFIGAGVY